VKQFFLSWKQQAGLTMVPMVPPAPHARVPTVDAHFFIGHSIRFMFCIGDFWHHCFDSVLTLYNLIHVYVKFVSLSCRCSFIKEVGGRWATTENHLEGHIVTMLEYYHFCLSTLDINSNWALTVIINHNALFYTCIVLSTTHHSIIVNCLSSHTNIKNNIMR